MVLIKYSGKYVKIYFNMKITCQQLTIAKNLMLKKIQNCCVAIQCYIVLYFKQFT